MPVGRATLLSAIFVGAGLTVLPAPASADRAAVIAATYPDYSLLPPTTSQIVVCHDFGCKGRTVLAVTAADRARLAGMLAGGRGSPGAERDAIAAAGAWFDRRIGRAAGTVNHVARAGASYAFKSEGQLDCIDTSRNTTTLLLLLDMLKLLHHHDVAPPAARGFLIDGKVPHATAVLRDRAGTRWSVDAWTRAYGRKLEIMPLARWFAAD